MAILAAIGSGFRITLADTSPSDFVLGGGMATASYSLESDGDIVTAPGPVDIGDWIAPRHAAGGNWEVRATVLSGALSSGVSGNANSQALALRPPPSPLRSAARRQETSTARARSR